MLCEYWLKVNKEYKQDWPKGDERADPEYPTTASGPPGVRHVRFAYLDVPVSELWSHVSHRMRISGSAISASSTESLLSIIWRTSNLHQPTLSALQHNAELTGNPIFIEPANSGLNRVSIINRPGQRLTVSGPQAMANRPDWLTPPAMPQQVMDLVQFWISRIENTMSLSALQKGITPTQRNAEGALNMVQEAAFVRVRSALTNLQMCLQRSAVKLADLIVDNYTTPRVMAIIGEDGEMVAKALAGQHFQVPSNHGMTPLKYIMRIEAGSGGPTSRTARMAEADRLFGLGAVDDQYVLAKHRVRQPKAILERLYAKRQQGLIGVPGKSSSK